MDPALESNTEQQQPDDIFPQNALLMRVMILFLTTLVLALGAIYVLRQPDSAAFIWYANGFCIAFIAVAPSQHRFPLFCTAFFAIVFANLILGDPLLQSLELGLANTLTMILGTLSLVMISKKSAPFLSVHGFTTFVMLTTLLSPIPGAIIGGLALETAINVPVQSVAPSWYFGDVIGIIAITPLTYTVLQQQRSTPATIFRPTSIFVVIAVVALSNWLLSHYPHPFVAIAVLLAFAGALLDRVATFTTIFLVSVSLDLLLVHTQNNVALSTFRAENFEYLIPVAGAMLLGTLLAVKAARLTHLQKLSNERYETLSTALQSSVIGTAVMLNDGYLQGANASFQALTGFSSKELDKKLFRQLLFFRDKPAYQEGMSSLLSAEKDSFQADMRITKKNKQVIWALVGVTAVRDIVSKEVTKFILQIQNIDTERRLDDERTLWAKKFDFALTVSRTTLYEMECHTKFMHLSENAEQCIGIKAHNIKRLYEWMSRIHPEDLREYQHAVSHIATTAMTLEYRLMDDKDQYHWVRDHCQPIDHDTNGVASRVIGTVSDIHHEKSASASQIEQERYKAVVDDVCHLGVWEYIPKTGEVFWNGPMYALFGQSLKSTVSVDMWKGLIAAKDRPVLDQVFSIARTKTTRLEANIQRVTDEEQLVSLTVTAQVIRDDKGTRILGACREASLLQHENVLLGEANSQLSSAIEMVSDGIMILDARFRVIKINDTALGLIDIDKGQILGEHIDHHINIFLRSTPFTFENLFSSNQTDTSLNGLFTLQAKHGKERKIYIEGCPVNTENNRQNGWILKLSSPDSLKAKSTSTNDTWTVSKDPVTGLLTRIGFEHALQAHIESLPQNTIPHSLMVIELRGLTNLGNALGTAISDQLLKSTTLILKSHLRSKGTLARIEPNQFSALLEGAGLADTRALMETTIEKLGALDYPQKERFPLDAIAGITAAESTKSTPLQLIYQAQLAKDYVHENSSSNIVVFDKAFMSDSIKPSSSNLLQQIDTAIQTGSFSLLSLPIVPMYGDDVTWHEVLIRLITDNGELMKPCDFLSAAEPTGRLGQIENWVFSEVLINQSEKLRDKKLHIAVNISTGSFYNDVFVSACLDMIKESALPSSQLCIEVQESTLLIDVVRAKEIVSAFRKLGCKVAIDNFGAQMTSFHYLKKFNINFIKIDGNLAALGSASNVERRILESIKQISDSLRVKTVAQKVNSEEDLTLMRELGISFTQGYYWGEPLPLSQLIQRATDDNTPPKFGVSGSPNTSFTNNK